MEGRFMIEDPKAVVYTLKVTATAEEFEKLRDQLVREWPSSRLSNMLSDLLAQARTIMWENTDVH